MTSMNCNDRDGLSVLGGDVDRGGVMMNSQNSQNSQMNSQFHDIIIIIVTDRNWSEKRGHFSEVTWNICYLFYFWLLQGLQ